MKVYLESPDALVETLKLLPRPKTLSFYNGFRFDAQPQTLTVSLWNLDGVVVRRSLPAQVIEEGSVTLNDFNLVSLLSNLKGCLLYTSPSPRD
mgnify:CR=1 FL=1